MDHLHLSGEINGSSKSNGFQRRDHLHLSGEINGLSRSNGFQLMDHLHLSGEINGSSKSNGFQLMDSRHISGEINGSSKSTSFQIAADSSFRDWAGLLPELVDMILKRLHEFPDYLHFCGVCSGWRSVLLRDTSSHRQNLDLLKTSRNKLPMLLFKTEENNSDDRSLYSVSDGKTYKLQLPLPYRRRFIGSSHGWLICCEENEVITLLNPLTKDSILLPEFSDEMCDARWGDLSEYPEYFLRKAILTAAPHISPNDYAVILIYSDFHQLAVYRSGDIKWKIMEKTYYDVVCHNNNVYGITLSGELCSVDLDSGREKLILEGYNINGDLLYLVESQKELLLIQRAYEIESNLEEGEEEEEVEVRTEEVEMEGYGLVPVRIWDDPRPPRRVHLVTTDFIVSKLVCEKGNAKFVQVNNIGEQALFVGGNDSVSISTIEFPECLPNSIYFTNELHVKQFPYLCGGLDEDSGIFNIKDKSFHFHRRLDMCEWYTNPPIWFVPNLAMKS